MLSIEPREQLQGRDRGDLAQRIRIVRIMLFEVRGVPPSHLYAHGWAQSERTMEREYVAPYSA